MLTYRAGAPGLRIPRELRGLLDSGDILYKERMKLLSNVKVKTMEEINEQKKQQKQALALALQHQPQQQQSDQQPQQQPAAEFSALPQPEDTQNPTENEPEALDTAYVFVGPQSKRKKKGADGEGDDTPRERKLPPLLLTMPVHAGTQTRHVLDHFAVSMQLESPKGVPFATSLRLRAAATTPSRSAQSVVCTCISAVMAAHFTTPFLRTGVFSCVV